MSYYARLFDFWSREDVPENRRLFCGFVLTGEASVGSYEENWAGSETHQVSCVVSGSKTLGLATVLVFC